MADLNNLGFCYQAALPLAAAGFYGRVVRASVGAAGSYAPDMAAGCIHVVTLGGDITINAPVNVPVSQLAGLAPFLFLSLQNKTGLAANAAFANVAGGLRVGTFAAINNNLALTGLWYFDATLNLWLALGAIASNVNIA